MEWNAPARLVLRNAEKLLFCRSLIGRLLVLFSKRTEAVDIDIGWRSGGVETANKGASKRLGL